MRLRHSQCLKQSQRLGDHLFPDHNIFRQKVNDVLETLGRKLSASDIKTILRTVSWRDENAPPVVAKVHKPGKAQPDALRGLYEVQIGSKNVVVEYEPDSELRDTEQVPLLEHGGVEAFIRREVLPYTSDAWIDESKTKVGYEISFTHHFYKPQPLRSLEDIRADILAVEKEAEGLLDELLGKANRQ
jgi:type I restriction enzyme M protein